MSYEAGGSKITVYVEVGNLEKSCLEPCGTVLALVLCRLKLCIYNKGYNVKVLQDLLQITKQPMVKVTSARDTPQRVVRCGSTLKTVAPPTRIISRRHRLYGTFPQEVHRQRCSGRVRRDQ